MCVAARFVSHPAVDRRPINQQHRAGVNQPGDRVRPILNRGPLTEVYLRYSKISMN